MVLSGGGALGAYEVGVLKVLEKIRLRPAIVAGVSVGAINAVLWIAHGFRTAPLERVWSRLRASSVGMHWATLTVRGFGAFVVTLASVQILLTIMGSPELSPRLLVAPHGAAGSELAAALLDVVAWLAVAVFGVLVMRGSRGAEDALGRLSPMRDPHRLHQGFGWVLLLGLLAHLAAWLGLIPWPQRFSASLLLVGGFVWMLNRPGREGDRLRRMILRVLPETGGRGIWGSAARKRLIRRVVANGDPAALLARDTHLIISACDVESGQMRYFVNWSNPSPEFHERIRQAVGDVSRMRTPQEVIDAALASSAVPGVFEPVRIDGAEFVDGGVFSNQPLHAVIADGADAVIVVLVSPSTGPPKPPQAPTLFELVGRLLEIANWRDLQTELRGLPDGWTRNPSAGKDRAGDPASGAARVCVVEPDGVLPGGFYGLSSSNAAELQRRGERDAWTALEAAGWIDGPREDETAALAAGAARPRGARA